jgi:hypothetical protein
MHGRSFHHVHPRPEMGRSKFALVLVRFDGPIVHCWATLGRWCATRTHATPPYPRLLSLCSIKAKIRDSGRPLICQLVYVGGFHQSINGIIHFTSLVMHVIPGPGCVYLISTHLHTSYVVVELLTN